MPRAALRYVTAMRGSEFRGTWRDYQAAVLDRAEQCLADNRVHVVAAPGSGKTVLGLELVRRLGRPALVLAPTVPIRSQWVDRLCALFLGATVAPDWVSTSLDAPCDFTVATYQALYAAARPFARGEVVGPSAANRFDPALLARLTARGPMTLVLDEAHHLRREWWSVLNNLVDALPEPRVIALTATPPFDVPFAEWQRYEALCGPIDAEISAPELVRNGDLCPHQDYVHVSIPTAAEADLLTKRRMGLIRLFEAILSDRDLLDALSGHGWLADPEAHEEAILDDPEFVSSLVIALSAAGRPRPRATLQLLGIEHDPIPRMTPYWLERLLDGILTVHRDAFGPLSASLSGIRSELQRLGAFEGGRVRIRETERLVRLMAGSAAKLGSIVEIAKAESAALGERLRMVVLADHVRLADLPGEAGERAAPAKLGVATIFKTLREADLGPMGLGVLSGPLVIVPDAALAALGMAARACGIAGERVGSAPLANCPGFSRVTFRGETGHRIVAVITQLFGEGHIRVLVGTQSLLGEGWDAPSANSLVLASNVGAYMLSNQMRGRAIRIDPADSQKVANIWHLATVSPDVEGPVAHALRGFSWDDRLPPSDPIGRELGPDMELLKRRFRTFAGIAADGPPRIENGLARLGLRGRSWDEGGIAATNARTLGQAADRAMVAERWAISVGDAGVVRTMRQAVRSTYVPRGIAILDTLQYLALAGLGGGALSAGSVLRNAGNIGFGGLMIAFGGLTLLYGAPKLLRALWLLLRNGTLETSLRQVGETVVESLDRAGLLTLPTMALAVAVERTFKGERIVTLKGADRATERMFVDAIAEILAPVRNSRYLLVRRSFLARRLRVDYHAVPTVLAQRKEWAEIFAGEWRKRVGRAQLVFTRTARGRRLLLRARARSMAAGLQRDVGLLAAWR